MANKTPKINPIDELGTIMQGETLEALAGLLLDPTANLTTAARDTMYDRLSASQVPREVENGVLFEYRQPHERMAVDVKKVKALYPLDQCPDLYTRRALKGTVRISL